ncbi:MAG: enoyl-CoA hydratase/isomerase family protein [Actinomycetes bacterium]
MSDSVLYDVADAVATVTLNRPEAMNSLNTETKEALRDAVLRAADDPGVRAVILAGNGRAFCVGQDLKEHIDNLQGDPQAVWDTVPEHYNPIALALATMPKPVVAAVNGVAAGAGASFAFACDFRVVAETAGFNLAFTAVGLAADSGASWTLPRLVGYARATDLLMRPTTIKAPDALALGLATEVVPAEAVLTRARELATELAAGPTVAFATVKASLAYAATHDVAESLAFEHEMQNRAGSTEDHLAAVTAFVAKEKPVFKGR